MIQPRERPISKTVTKFNRTRASNLQDPNAMSCGEYRHKPITFIGRCWRCNYFFRNRYYSRKNVMTGIWKNAFKKKKIEPSTGIPLVNAVNFNSNIVFMSVANIGMWKIIRIQSTHKWYRTCYEVKPFLFRPIAVKNNYDDNDAEEDYSGVVLKIRFFTGILNVKNIRLIRTLFYNTAESDWNFRIIWSSRNIFKKKLYTNCVLGTQVNNN